MSKRTISDLLNDGHIDAGESKPHNKPRLEIQDDKPQRSLSYPNTSQPTAQQTPFQQPTQLISFSYNPSRELEFTDSALRYFVDPPLGAKLGYGYERWVRRPEQRGRLDGLVQAFSKARSRDTSSLDDVGVVAWRGVMTKILTSPYEEKEGWELNVMFVNGTMYFEEHLSESRLKEKNDMEPRHRLQSYYGYAFESYCTSDSPTRQMVSSNPSNPMGWGGDVDTNVQWCSVVRTKLGSTRLVIGGEVDCVREKYTHQTDTFVELKTSLAIRGPHDEAKFERKLLKFYFQSFLLGVPEILVGFRTPSGVVTTIQSFKTIQIPRLVRGKPGAWDPLVCLDWGNRFLSFLKDVVKREVAQHDAPTLVWRVKFAPKAGVTVDILDPGGVQDVEAGEDRVGFLPKWYWDELHPDRAHMASPTRTEEDKQTSQNLPSEVPPTLYAGWQI
ncbi:Decapping nuclease RAI1 [Hypsizygus marmoreus]|uniref:Decapping nuclease n=1 Tax=Hypsizygus marmoreus TaxID=39966 RepID=A0A369JX77_HYPMA|nr:Decapping nuclease RAI1 [Hypsizygus marmoreus]